MWILIPQQEHIVIHGRNPDNLCSGPAVHGKQKDALACPGFKPSCTIVQSIDPIHPDEITGRSQVHDLSLIQNQILIREGPVTESITRIPASVKAILGEISFSSVRKITGNDRAIGISVRIHQSDFWPFPE